MIVEYAMEMNDLKKHFSGQKVDKLTTKVFLQTSQSINQNMIYIELTALQKYFNKEK